MLPANSSGVRLRSATVIPAVFFVLVCLALEACVPIPIRVGFKRERVLASYAPTIVRGSTTRAEVERELGPPDVEADGTYSRVNPGTPLVKHFDKLKAQRSWMSNVPHSSLSAEHVALLYLEIEARQFMLVNPFFVGLAGYRVTIARNKLLVLVNKSSGVVEEIAYTHEFDR